MSACERCLRRGELIGLLAGRIAGLLGRPRHRASGLLALSDQRLIAALGGPREPEIRRFLDSWDAGRARERIERARLGAVCRHAAGYPERLHQLVDPPAVLYFTGSLERLIELSSTDSVAIVGTRRPSPYGLRVATDLGRGLAVAGVTVVSGLALGIDAAAHRGSCEVDGPAIAVLAGGADVPYPASHAPLYNQLRRCGTVISELPPGQRPYRWSFPARNRIMAGLARVVVVVEAADPSGSLITAQFAEKLGRDIAAVPGRANSKMARGSNGLLKDGAAFVCGPEDVLELMFGVGHGLATRAPVELDPVSERVLLAVEAGIGAAELPSATDLDSRQVRAALGRLELAGLVARDPLGAYERTALA